MGHYDGSRDGYCPVCEQGPGVYQQGGCARDDCPAARKETIVEVVNPNDMQVGGDHYRSAYQHWDVVEEHGIGYIEGCATKYVTRHKRKNGLQDLEKAWHFVVKLRALMKDPGVRRQPRGRVNAYNMGRFLHLNSITGDEAIFVTLLFQWETHKDLDGALHALARMKAKYIQPEEELTGKSF